MRKLISLITILGLFVLVFYSCKKDQVAQSSALTVAEGACAEKTVDLTAGQTIKSGTVTISNDATNLYVKVTLSDNATFASVSENLKLWVGDDFATLPVGGSDNNPSCSPQNGQFPWKATVDPLENTYTFTIKYSDIEKYLGKTIDCSSALNVVLHADLIVNGQPETAFGGEVAANCQRWWFYTVYQGVCCTPPPPPSGSVNTAFAKGGYIFTSDSKSNPDKLPSLNLTKNRWGWAINIPATTGTKTYNLYSGAGLNNIKNGKLVGTVTISYDGSVATVTYNTIAGYDMTGLHIYAGDFKPTTIAPGQYGYIANFIPVHSSTHTATFTLADTNGDGLWFICHAGVFGK